MVMVLKHYLIGLGKHFLEYFVTDMSAFGLFQTVETKQSELCKSVKVFATHLFSVYLLQT